MDQLVSGQLRTRSQQIPQPGNPAPPPPQPLPSPQILTENIIKFHSSKMAENLTKFKEYQDKFTKFSKTIQIDFLCNLSKNIVGYAVQLQECAKNCKHFEAIMDLTIFLTQIYTSSTINSFECPTCKTKTTFDKIENAFFPHLLVNDLKKKCGEIPKQLTYIFKQKIQYPNHLGDMGKKQNEYLDEIITQFEKQKNNSCQLNNIIQITQIKSDILLFNICLLSSLKIQIPVRGNQCKHFELYDLTALLNHFKTKNIQQFECRLQGCGALISLNQISIDYDWLEDIFSGYSFSFQFQYLYDKKKAYDILLLKKDENLLSYRQLEGIEYEKYSLNIYKQVDQIYNDQKKNEEKTEQFYQNKQNLKNEGLDFTICNKSGFRIEIPCRCIRCPQLQTCDLRYMCCIMHQFQDQIDIRGVKNKIIDCPLCGSKFQKKVKPKDPVLKDQVYVDLKMLQYLGQPQSYIKANRYNFFCYLENKKPIELINNQDSILQTGIIISNISLICPISKKNIQIPIRGNNCKHPQPFDQEIIQMNYDGKINLSDMKCPVLNCNQKFDCFYQDNFLFKALEDFKLYNKIGDNNMIGIKAFNGKITIQAKK